MNRDVSRIGSAFFWLALFGLTGCDLIQPASWIPPSPIGEVAIRQIPAYNAIEAEIKGTIDKSWPKGFRQDARYLTTITSPLQYPVLINVPDWEDHPPEPVGVFYVQLMLKDDPNYAGPREKGLSVVSFGAKMVACYAWEGAYTYENFTGALNRIRQELQQRGIPSAGAPRVLLYRNPDWTLKRWCVGEVQVPVPDKITAD